MPQTSSHDLDRRVAVVTGGAGGIGFATVEALAAAGAMPVLVDRDTTTLERASKSLEARGIPHRIEVVDVTDGTAVDCAFEAITHWRGRIDILVNNAGIALRRPSLDLSQEDWQKVIDVNLTGAFLCARASARTMLAHGGGAIVNVGSIMSFSGGGLYPNISYQASKGAIVNLTRALAVEWASGNVRVNAVAPTWVRTQLTETLMNDPVLVERMMAMTPLRRLAEPQDVAAAIVFLVSDKARMITGHTLAIDGGFLAQ